MSIWLLQLPSRRLVVLPVHYCDHEREPTPPHATTQSRLGSFGTLWNVVPVHPTDPSMHHSVRLLSSQPLGSAGAFIYLASSFYTVVLHELALLCPSCTSFSRSSSSTSSCCRCRFNLTADIMTRGLKQISGAHQQAAS